ncbi:MAG: patatin-like phospholipase family protein [Gammaproteobacteria bacterium]|nr:patatin-like phospholipase family protein [Gammaproteobacteria bacterium]MDH5260048.1 patatin-like phospholipase family protein [Gammaproteobacteria bacterium]MDH5620930.1 patatin-like phospholipase family protein [Gammaproteobacteria bacterium]
MKPVTLTFKAGAGALRSVKTHGFDISSIGTIAGASGGAKWLVLSQLDRAILTNLVPKLQGPVHLLGTSIGAWRFSCYAQSDPVAAIDRFENAYIEQSFSERPDIQEITAKSREIIDVILGAGGRAEILNHPVFRTHVMAVRSRHVLATENRWLLTVGLLTAASLNLISRRTLGMFFERALFYDARDLPPFFEVGGFPLQQIVLSETNLADAIVATGSIPLVLQGVRDIDGARPGVYRDGGVIDYHHDLPHSAKERLTLYPHFYDRIVPGWFDKRLGWRKPQPDHVDRTILVSPSDAFVAKLPNGKIPDRTDFVNYLPAERIAAWRACTEACKEMADEFNEVLEKDQLAARLEAL